MRRVVLAIAAIAALAVGNAAHAKNDGTGAPLSGSELYETCNVQQGDPTYAARSTVCAMYVTAVLDMVSVFGPMRRGDLFYSFGCSPPGVRIGVSTDLVMHFLSTHPDDRNLEAPELVRRALWEAFPCPK